MVVLIDSKRSAVDATTTRSNVGAVTSSCRVEYRAFSSVGSAMSNRYVEGPCRVAARSSSHREVVTAVKVRATPPRRLQRTANSRSSLVRPLPGAPSISSTTGPPRGSWPLFASSNTSNLVVTSSNPTKAGRSNSSPGASDAQISNPWPVANEFNWRATSRAEGVRRFGSGSKSALATRARSCSKECCA